MRVPVGDFATVSRALDFGAEAIIAPMINTAADARALRSRAKLHLTSASAAGAAPRHHARPICVDQKEYLRDANDGTLTLAMIETRDRSGNADAIATTPGIDALFLGPADLSIALSGGKAQKRRGSRPSARSTRSRRATKAGKIRRLLQQCRTRSAMAKRGFRFITIGSDLGILREGAAAQVKALRK